MDQLLILSGRDPLDFLFAHQIGQGDAGQKAIDFSREIRPEVMGQATPAVMAIVVAA